MNDVHVYFIHSGAEVSCWKEMVAIGFYCSCKLKGRWFTACVGPLQGCGNQDGQEGFKFFLLKFEFEVENLKCLHFNRLLQGLRNAAVMLFLPFCMVGCFLDELCFLNILLLTIKDNSSRKNADCINMKDTITVAGTQKSPVFSPVFIQAGQVCCM